MTQSIANIDERGAATCRDNFPSMETSPSLFTARVDSLVEKASDSVRTEPTKTVLSAFGLGLLIHLLPIRTIVGGLAAVALTLARPFLLALGVMKAFELGCQQAAKTSDL